MYIQSVLTIPTLLVRSKQYIHTCRRGQLLIWQMDSEPFLLLPRPATNTPQHVEILPFLCYSPPPPPPPLPLLTLLLVSISEVMS